MSILRWILGAGVVGGLIYKTSKKAKDIAEEENRRKNTLCFFDDGISEYEFEILVKCAGKGIKRLKSITVVGPIVYGTVRTQSGLSEWHFNIDFNNYGHITGTYWLSSENDDSDIPKHIADNISSAINNYSSSTDYMNDCYEYQRDATNQDYYTEEHVLAFCPNFGKKVAKKGAKFCTFCGEKMN